MKTGRVCDSRAMCKDYATMSHSYSRCILFQYKISLKGRLCWDVNIRMDDRENLSLDAIDRFVEASKKIRFEAENRQQF
jgi:hypothetical protein